MMEMRIRGRFWRAKDRHDVLSNWHRWFAWYPVRLGEFEVRWLEWVDRRGTYHTGGGMECWWSFRYASISKGE